jgi:hypothetical protein
MLTVALARWPVVVPALVCRRRAAAPTSSATIAFAEPPPEQIVTEAC